MTTCIHRAQRDRNTALPPDRLHQSILAGIAKTDKDSDVRGRIVARLTDQSVLADIAKNDTNKKVREAAQGHLIGV